MIGSRPALFAVWHLAGWTMLHFIWAGSLVAVLAALGRQLLRRAHPDVRYAYALASLTLLAAAPAVIAAVLAAGSFAAGAPTMEGTWSTASPVAQPRETVPVLQSAAEQSARTEPPPLLKWADVLVDFLPGVWLVGAPLTFIYMAAGLWGAERLRRRSQPVGEDALSALCNRLADGLGVGRQVAVGVCDRVAAPLVLGIARPLIVLPSAFMAGWSGTGRARGSCMNWPTCGGGTTSSNLLQRVVEISFVFPPGRLGAVRMGPAGARALLRPDRRAIHRAGARLRRRAAPAGRRHRRAGRARGVHG